MMIRFFKKRHSSFVNPESNETKCDSNDCEAGPSKKPKKDDSSMIEDVNKDLILNSSQSNEKLASKSTREVMMNESFNILPTYHGNASNNSIHVVNHFNFTKESTILVKDESSIADKTVTSEVFPNDKEVMKIIWKYLNFKDKKECTLVCKRFNDIISNMDCFRLVLKRKSMLQIIPKVSRSYKTLVIQGYRCKTLKPAMYQMLNRLSQSVVDLTLDGCEFDLMTFIEFLRDLPLLESLKLNIILTIDIDSDLSVEDLPNLSKLKDFNIKVNEKFKETLDITGSALNLESITLFDAIIDNDLIDYLIKYKNSLTTLSLTKCIKEPPSYKTNLNSLHFDSSFNLPTVNIRIFDCLEKLRNLELINVNDKMIDILYTKCLREITSLKIIYNYEQRDQVGFYFDYFYDFIHRVPKRRKVGMSGSDSIKIIECSIPQGKETENLYENPLILSYQVDHDRPEGYQELILASDLQFLRVLLDLNNQCLEWLMSHFHVRVKIDYKYQATKHEYYKIRDVPHNASFSDSDYDVMDEDKLSFDDDSDDDSDDDNDDDSDDESDDDIDEDSDEDSDSDLDNFIQLLKNVLSK